MTDLLTVWREILTRVEGAAVSQGRCACAALPHVVTVDSFKEAEDDMLGILAGILRHSVQGETDGNVSHFLTAVLATGYALGAHDTGETPPLSVPDSLAALDFTEPRPGERDPRE